MHMTPSKLGMYDFKPTVSRMTTASGDTFESEGFGSLDIEVISQGVPQTLHLNRVMHVPGLSYNLFSLKAAANHNLTYWGDKSGIRLFLKNGNNVLFSPLEGLYCISGYRTTHAEEYANAVLAPSIQNHGEIDVNDFHVSYGHAHENLLCETAKRMGIKLSRTLKPCSGCSLGKGLRKGIPSSTSTRAVKKLGRVFVDVSGPKPIPSIGGNIYTCLIRDDFTRMTWVYFLRRKSDATEAFKQFLADVRADGVPSTVEIVRSDGGGEFCFDGDFGDLCRDRGIKQELTTADSTEMNGIAERALSMIEARAMAACLQAKEIFAGIPPPSSDRL